MPELDERSLLIALNAHPKLARSWIYRLAEDLSWTSAAAETGSEIPQPVLTKARAALLRAPALAAAEEAKAAALGGRVVVRGEAAYPAGLLDLPLPPPVLSLRGAIPDAPAVAIVGSRRPDEYGLEAAAVFSGALAAAGLVVVSGFARGIDAAAHRAALAARGGATLAVLGCGLGVAYPVAHRELAEAIAGRGAVISEFPCEARPAPWHFPLRNRTIAALSRGTLVVRAAPRSGSLITARHALDLGKTVWAVPGAIFDELSLGPNALLRDGAAPALHPRDLLDELWCEGTAGSKPAGGREDDLVRHPAAERLPSAPSEPPAPAGFAGTVWAAIPKGSAISAEELARLTGAGADRVLTTLLDLEIEGLVRKLPGFGYAR